MRDPDPVPAQRRLDAAAAVGPPGLSAAQRLAMGSLLRDRQTATVCRYLREAGVSVLVLKGPAIGHWLWPDVPRPYGDADLMVKPLQFEDAEAVPLSHGHTRTIFPESAGIAVEYYAPDSGHISVDLHRSFRLVGVSPERCWSLLAADARSLELFGGAVPIPSQVGLAVIVALHAVWHGVEAPRGAEDVRRVVARLDITGWREAKQLAAALGCLEAFAAGLHTVREGSELAARIGLASVSKPEFRLRLGDRPPTSLAWLDLFSTRRSPRELGSVLLRELVPSAAEMRRQSSRELDSPLALILSYAVRLVRLAAAGPRGIVAARRALSRSCVE